MKQVKAARPSCGVTISMLDDESFHADGMPLPSDDAAAREAAATTPSRAPHVVPHSGGGGRPVLALDSRLTSDGNRKVVAPTARTRAAAERGARPQAQEGPAHQLKATGRAGSWMSWLAAPFFGT